MLLFHVCCLGESDLRGEKRIFLITKILYQESNKNLSTKNLYRDFVRGDWTVPSYLWVILGSELLCTELLWGVVQSTRAHTSSCMQALRDVRRNARTHACMHARKHACTHACTHARTHAYTNARNHARTHTRTHTRTHARNSQVELQVTWSVQRKQNRERESVTKSWLGC